MVTTEVTASAERVSYNFAVLRVVPHVYVGACVPVGVLVHARTAEYLDIRVLTSVEGLRARVPDVDVELLVRYLHACEAIARGEAHGGTMALIPPSERFHWLTAPRSDVLQCSAVHEGVCTRLDGLLERLYSAYIDPPAGEYLRT